MSRASFERRARHLENANVFETSAITASPALQRYLFPLAALRPPRRDTSCLAHKADDIIHFFP